MELFIIYQKVLFNVNLNAWGNLNLNVTQGNHIFLQRGDCCKSRQAGKNGKKSAGKTIDN